MMKYEERQQENREKEVGKILIGRCQYQKLKLFD
jgi:hypothetical protein